MAQVRPTSRLASPPVLRRTRHVRDPSAATRGARRRWRDSGGGIEAYDGAIRYVDAGDNLQVGAQIATVEARHAAYLNLITRQSPFPSAFDAGKKPSEIVAAVLATGFITKCEQPVLDLFAKFKTNGA
ncbi:MAG: ferritin-like domain-containing protein [Actinobacteria bacterium]|nr:ferritin-like domain-containing protein [Actinomycetota bacterium]